MSEHSDADVLGPEAVSQTDRPAIGLPIHADTASDEFAAAILRARLNGWNVMTVATPASAEEAIDFAHHLGVPVVESSGSLTNGTELQSQLASVARRDGLPGVGWQEDVTTRVDFDATADALGTSESYVIDVHEAPVVDSEPHVLVAIPAFNEARTVGEVVEGALPHADEVLVVDDGSTDETAQEAEAAGATVISHETNCGYGAALKTAFEEAHAARADHLVVLDSDGQHDPSDIPDLLAEQREEKAELVIGSRFVEGGETNLPLYRLFGLRVVNALTNLSTGVVRKRSRIADTQCGFRAYDRTAIESLAADDSITSGMGASTDILHHAHTQNYDIREVGTTVDYNGDHQSTHNPVSHGIQLVMNILRTIEEQRPVSALGVPGFISTIVGLGFAYATMANYVSSGTFPLGLALLSVFFTLAGILAAFTAIILHSLNTHLGGIED